MSLNWVEIIGYFGLVVFLIWLIFRIANKISEGKVVKKLKKPIT